MVAKGPSLVGPLLLKLKVYTGPGPGTGTESIKTERSVLSALTDHLPFRTKKPHMLKYIPHFNKNN